VWESKTKKGQFGGMKWLGLGFELSGLAVHSIMDLRSGEISLWLTAIYAAVGTLWRIFAGTLTWEIFFSLIPGVLCLCLAKMTAEKVGYGDGFLLLALGCYLGWEDMLLLCMTALIGGGICGLILMLFFHKKKDYEIPFVPFLFLGDLIVRCMT
jgi:leader peptidase (prepilin peptidase)/N-methyltransferase